MSRFALEKELFGALNMDVPIAKGSMPRWQRKALEASTSSVNNSLNVSNNMSQNSSISQSISANVSRSTSTDRKTPSKTPGKLTTPGRNKTPKTPTESGDRFIPNRSGMQFDIGHFLLTQDKTEKENEPSPHSKEYQKRMNENLNGDLSNFRVLAYQNKAQAPPEGHANNLRVIYSSSKTPCSTKKSRYIPQMAEKILDAPEMVDNYYLNILDWSVTNNMAVALGSHVYIWNATTGEIHQLMELENSQEYISSLAWIKEGNFLAVGTSTAQVQLWDVTRMMRFRTMQSHTARVGALSWNSYILSSGSQTGQIHHHDVRVAQHHVATLAGHSQEVCGLKWSKDGRYLASGGNDNVLNVWLAASGNCLTDNQPLHTFTHHQAAVKAVAWCPWQPSLLASGGGTNDRCIRIWNCNVGVLQNTIDTKSQVCALLWSKDYKELISGHGFANCELVIWKYPTMAKVAELRGHSARVLNLAMSPDGSTVVSAGADETLRLWKCFAIDHEKKTMDSKSVSSSCNTLKALSIR